MKKIKVQLEVVETPEEVSRIKEETTLSVVIGEVMFTRNSPRNCRAPAFEVFKRRKNTTMNWIYWLWP